MHRIEQTRVWRGLRYLVAIARYRREMARLDRYKGAKKPALLVLNHYFDNEVKALLESPAWRQRYEIVPVNHWNLFNRNLWYYPPSVWVGRVACEEPSLAGPRRRSRRFAQRILRDLARRLRVVAVASPSDSFWWLREFYFECQAQGIRTFVFDKEGTISPATWDTHHLMVRNYYPPIAEHYYFWNRRVRDFWARCGVPASRMRVLGSLRTDRYVQMPPPTRKAILFFDFDSTAYLTTLSEEDRRRFPQDWSTLKGEIYDVLRSVARMHPGVLITIKCHPQQLDISQTRKSFRDLGPNVRVVTGSQGVDALVAQHSMVVGFQTTALLEVGLTDRPNVYCGWGPLHEALEERLVPLMKPGYGVLPCPDAATLHRWIEDHLADRWTQPRPSRERLDEFFHQADGQVGARFLEAFEKDLSEPAPGPLEPEPLHQVVQPPSTTRF